MRGAILKRAGNFLYLCVLFTLLFAALFAALKAEHHCTHDDYCPVCLQIQGALRLLKHLGSVHPRLIAAAVLFVVAALFSKFRIPCFAAPTSVNLKIRMNT